MTTADALRFAMSICLSLRWFPPCRRAGRAGAFAPHVARHSGRGAAPPVHRRPERQHGSKAQGKIKGRGTPRREKLVCTWGWCGTRREMAACCNRAQCRIGVGEIACFARRSATVLDGGAS